MDFATLVGLIGAIGVIMLAVFLGGDPIIYVNVPSIFIVVGGTIFAVSIKFSVKKIAGAFKVAGKAFMFKLDDTNEMIQVLVELANKARKGGPLALENVPIDNKFLKKGVDMVVDGIDLEVVKQVMYKEKTETYKRHEEGQRIFKSMGDVAPAMGMIGTLIGLVAMLANMSDPKSIGPAMAVALLTTLYGAIIANVVALPIADKLEMRANEEEQLQSMIIDSVIMISKSFSGMIVEQALKSYLPQLPGDAKKKEAA